MESLVSLIQRSWSQLDIDACMLLDSLGDSEFLAQNNEYDSDLLNRVLNVSNVSNNDDGGYNVDSDVNSMITETNSLNMFKYQPKNHGA